MSKSSDHLDFSGRTNVKGRKSKHFQNLRSPSKLLSKSLPYEEKIKEVFNQNPTLLKPQSERKTPYEIFLEDDGPYSRKLFTPVSGESFQKNQFGPSKCEVHDDKKSQIIKKGLLWYKGDTLFSRWKEKLFLLTNDHIHCFKKESMKGLTQKEDYEFRVKLSSISTVSMYDKKGFLTVCLLLKGLSKARIFLRKAEGLRDWFNGLQFHVDDCKRRKSNFTLFTKTTSNQYYIEGATESEVNDEEEGKECDDNAFETDSLNAFESDNNKTHERFFRSSIVSDILAAKNVDSFDDVEDEKNDDSGVESGNGTDHTGCESLEGVKDEETIYEKVRCKISPDTELLVCHV